MCAARLLAIVVLAAAGVVPVAADEPPCVPNTRTCLPACIPGTPICLFEEPPACEIACPITIEITEYQAARSAGAVTVTVEVAGTLAGAAADSDVSGAVRITAPNPCWPDAGSGCVDVIDVQEKTFTATTDDAGAWSAAAGPFRYTAGGTGPACWTVKVHAEASHGAATASDDDEPELCA